MNNLDKTLQVQRSSIPLRAAGIASNLLFGSSVILITLALCPQPSLGEPSFSPPNDSTEDLTFNYAIANSYPRQGTSIETQTFPTSTIQNNQQSSILIDQTGKPTPGMTGLSSEDDSNQSSVEDLAQTPAHQIQSSDAGKPIDPSSVDVSQESNTSQNQRIFLSDENKFEALDTQTRFSINSSTKLRFYPADSSEQRSQVVLARFAKVFDQTWEAPQQRKAGAYGTIPLVLNDSVEKNLEYFQYGIHERFQSYLDRFHHYQDLVEPVFHELGLPPELMYLSLVESGFNPRAFSRSRASGPWQFMKGTGRVYGLDVDWYLDERRDPIKSTVAAAHHLRDLYDQFGSWPLALGAYNAGSGKISRAIKKTGTRDFWTIRQSRHIRRETKDYVPRFIAATLIAQNPTAYGFSTPDGDRHEFEEVLITKRVHLSAVTQQTGIPVEELQRLNPELRRSIVPSLTGPGYYLKVPLGMASLVEELHPTLAVWSQPPPPPTEWHTVRQRREFIGSS